MVYGNGLWVPCDHKDIIRLNPDSTERIRCSRCGKEFASRGIKDYAFAYIRNGAPVYVVRPDILCYECEEEDEREKAEDVFIGGQLSEEEQT